MRSTTACRRRAAPSCPRARKRKPGEDTGHGSVRHRGRRRWRAFSEAIGVMGLLARFFPCDRHYYHQQQSHLKPALHRVAVAKVVARVDKTRAHKISQAQQLEIARGTNKTQECMYTALARFC